MSALEVLAICGSLRKQSFNKALIRTLPALAPEGMRIVDAPPIATIPHYDADVQNEHGFPEPVNALVEAIRSADGVIFATPEYNFSVPGVLKNAIDWISRIPDQPLAGKPVAIQSASTSLLGGARGQYHLRQIMVFVEAHVFNKPEIFIAQSAGKFDLAGGVLTDETARNLVAKQLDGFAHFIRQLKK